MDLSDPFIPSILPPPLPALSGLLPPPTPIHPFSKLFFILLLSSFLSLRFSHSDKLDMPICVGILSATDLIGQSDHFRSSAVSRLFPTQKGVSQIQHNLRIHSDIVKLGKRADAQPMTCLILRYADPLRLTMLSMSFSIGGSILIFLEKFSPDHLLNLPLSLGGGGIVDIGFPSSGIHHSVRIPPPSPSIVHTNFNCILSGESVNIVIGG